jgi:NAD+-dependent protein deacetylase sirtuin 4
LAFDVAAIAELLRTRAVVALTGAGLSVESGIPGYRGVGARGRAPMMYREFAGSEAARARYWSRSFAGFPRFERARPNRAHSVLAQLEAAGRLLGVITQNVDGLHGAAGSVRVVELHGRLSEVRCVECGGISARRALQGRLVAANPDLWARVSREAPELPDGDAEIEAAIAESFRVVGCELCGGVLRPNVVFFGENVPRGVTEAAYELFERAEVLLVAGTSLAVFSGHRFVLRAHERGMPIVIVNLGETRGDRFATVRVDAPVGEVLEAVISPGFLGL